MALAEVRRRVEARLPPPPTSAPGPWPERGDKRHACSAGRLLRDARPFFTPAPMFELSIDGGIATLRLRRPEARNAITLSGWGELADKAEEAVREGARVLILAGEPEGAFCAGADLASFDSFRDDAQARSGFRLAI